MAATLHDVARVADVSITTVSHVLNGTRHVAPATRERILAAIAQTQYHPSAIARSLKTQVTGTLGVAVSDITNPFFTTIVRAIEDVASNNDYNVIICNTDQTPEKEEKYLKVLLAKRIDGLIISPTGMPSPMLEAIYSMGVPIVFVDRSIPGMDLPMPTIKADNEAGAYAAISHLIEDGHSRIGIISGLTGVTSFQERYAGYERALLEHGLPVSAHYVKRGLVGAKGGAAAAEELLRLPERPTAIFAANNNLTLGAMQAIHESGLSCPQNIAIVGFDDHEWATILVPPLTVVRQPVYSIGAKAAQLVVDILRGVCQQPASLVLPSELVIRSSCSAHPPIPETSRPIAVTMTAQSPTL